MAPRVHLLGVPTNSSGHRAGVARAPAALRERGLVGRLKAVAEVTDAGDVILPDPVPERGASGILAETALIAMIETVRDESSRIRRDGAFPLLLGGDCPVMLGALAGLQAEAEGPGLLFVDGHEDAWPPRVSPTGEAADSELGLALRIFDHDLEPRLRNMLPTLRGEDVVAIGPRDQGELADADVASVDGVVRTLVRPEDVRDRTGSLVQSAVEALPRTWWLHVDLDVLATSELPAVDYLQDGGLTWDQLIALTRAALACDGCTGWSVCIYNPDLDPDRDSADAVIDYLAASIVSLHASS